MAVKRTEEILLCTRTRRDETEKETFRKASLRPSVPRLVLSSARFYNPCAKRAHAFLALWMGGRTDSAFPNGSSFHFIIIIIIILPTFSIFSPNSLSLSPSFHFAEMSAPSCSAVVPITGVSSGSSGPCSVPASIATSHAPPSLLSSGPKSLPPSLLQRSSHVGSGGGGVESKFWETRAALKDTKRKNREQARKARLLVTAVAAKIEEKDEEMERVSILVGMRNCFYFPWDLGIMCSEFCLYDF